MNIAGGPKKFVDEIKAGKRIFLTRHPVDPFLTQSLHNERDIPDSQRVTQIIGLPHMRIVSPHGAAGGGAILSVCESVLHERGSDVSGAGGGDNRQSTPVHAGCRNGKAVTPALTRDMSFAMK